VGKEAAEESSQAAQVSAPAAAPADADNAAATDSPEPSGSGRAANDPREVRRRQREAELRAQGIK